MEYIKEFIEQKKINYMIVHGLYSIYDNHRYIHESIYNLFINIYWIDDIVSELYSNLQGNYLIFSSPHYNTDINLPILNNAYYILHYDKINYITKQPIIRYDKLLIGKKAVKYVEFRYIPEIKENIDFIPNTFFWFNKEDNSIHQPWATNLFPSEIDKNIELVQKSTKLFNKDMKSYFCGSIWWLNIKIMNKWKKICEQNSIECQYVREKNEIIHQENIRNSFISPAIQGEEHCIDEKNFYIPCRIFKNISYGTIPITNNIGIYNLFKNYIVIYQKDLNKLFKKIENYYKLIDSDYNLFLMHKEKLIDIMIYVRNNHTYINRFENIIRYGFI